MKINDKETMYALLRKGEFGNTLGLWDTAADVIEAGHSMAAIRCLVPGKEFIYSVDVSMLEEERERYCIRNGVNKKQVIFAERDIGLYRIFSGEWWADECGSVLHYSFKNKNMRELMKDGPYFEHHATGIKANHIMNTYMDAEHVDWMWHLHRRFQTPVVEFTMFDKPCGTMHDRLVIWEVRHY